MSFIEKTSKIEIIQRTKISAREISIGDLHVAEGMSARERLEVAAICAKVGVCLPRVQAVRTPDDYKQYVLLGRVFMVIGSHEQTDTCGNPSHVAKTDRFIFVQNGTVVDVVKSRLGFGPMREEIVNAFWAKGRKGHEGRSDYVCCAWSRRSKHALVVVNSMSSKGEVTTYHHVKIQKSRRFIERTLNEVEETENQNDGS